jgi:hypothetical protein
VVASTSPVSTLESDRSNPVVASTLPVSFSNPPFFLPTIASSLPAIGFRHSQLLLCHSILPHRAPNAARHLKTGREHPQHRASLRPSQASPQSSRLSSSSHFRSFLNARQRRCRVPSDTQVSRVCLASAQPCHFLLPRRLPPKSPPFPFRRLDIRVLGCLRSLVCHRQLPHPPRPTFAAIHANVPRAISSLSTSSNASSRRRAAITNSQPPSWPWSLRPLVRPRLLVRNSSVENARTHQSP